MSDDYHPTNDEIKITDKDWRRATTKVIEKKNQPSKKRFTTTKDLISLIRSSIQLEK